MVRWEKLFAIAKGYRGKSKNVKKLVVTRARKALQHAYVGRKEKRRELRSLWITQIGAGARLQETNYSTLINDLKTRKIELDRKILSELAGNEPYSFRAICSVASMTPSLVAAERIAEMNTNLGWKRTHPTEAAALKKRNPKTQIQTGSDGWMNKKKRAKKITQKLHTKDSWRPDYIHRMRKLAKARKRDEKLKGAEGQQ
eukprot:g1285.t1